MLKYEFKDLINYSLFDSTINRGTKTAVLKSGLVIEREWKKLTRDEDHIIDSVYVNSINSINNGGIHDLVERNDGYQLNFGSNVDYAIYLEGRYNLGGRALDNSKAEARAMFLETFETYISKLL